MSNYFGVYNIAFHYNTGRLELVYGTNYVCKLQDEMVYSTNMVIKKKAEDDFAIYLTVIGQGNIGYRYLFSRAKYYPTRRSRVG